MFAVVVCSADDETEQIGVLGVTVECLQALQAISRELWASTEQTPNSATVVFTRRTGSTTIQLHSPVLKQSTF